jgi:monoamine oxidase
MVLFRWHKTRTARRPSNTPEKDSEYFPKKVAIIGGGLAGCCAAYFLHPFFDVTIFEQTDRLGGRVRTTTEVEFGAELIGLNHTLWLQFAKKFGLSFNVLTPEDLYTQQGCVTQFYDGDKLLTFDEMEELAKDIDVFQNSVKEDCKNLDPFNPWNEEDTLSILDKINSLDIHEYSKRLIAKQLECNNAASVDKQSYLSLKCQVKGGSKNGDAISFWSEQEVFRCANGAEELIKCLSKKIKCIYDCKLVEINVVEKTLYFENDRVVPLRGDYDICIFAVPPTEYPRLLGYDEKNNLPIGKLCKKFYSYEKRYWIHNNQSPNSLSTLYGETWEETENRLENRNEILVTFSTLQGGNEEKFKKAYPYKEFNTRINDTNGYSYVPVGKMNIIKSYQEEWKSLDIFLVGEHTDPVFFGFMEGALRSGKRVSELIFSKNKIEDI